MHLPATLNRNFTAEIRCNRPRRRALTNHRDTRYYTYSTAPKASYPYPYLTSLHLPDGRFDLPDRLELEAGLQRSAALVVPLESGLRSGALRLSMTSGQAKSSPKRHVGTTR